jgi:hypothetical protein
MLEKLATHDVQDISELFSLSDKCARTVEGCAWHSQPALAAGKASKPEADVAAQSSSKNKNKNKNRKKKKAGKNNKSLAGAPSAGAPTIDRCSALVVMRAVRDARCTTLGATTPRSAGRLRSSRSSSVSNRSSRRTTMAHLRASGKASNKLPTRVTRRRRRSSRMPRGRSRSSTATLTPPPNLATTSAACAPATSRPGTSSRRCAGQWQQLHLCRERHPTSSGWICCLPNHCQHQVVPYSD